VNPSLLKLKPPPNETPPLPPFTSGQPPICRLESSSQLPIPVILTSLGRSGTSSTWQVMSRLTGHCFEGDEYMGGNNDEMRDFFSHINPGNNGNWLLGYLCSQQILHKDQGGIVGIKWKSSKGTVFNNSVAMDALRMIAHYEEPQIKIIRSRRNSLDVRLSQLKHNLINEASYSHLSHCKTGDVNCIKRHKQHGTGIDVPTQDLLERMTKMERFQDRYDKMLDELKVPHIKVTYEKLYHSTDAEEWMRIFRFLGRGPGSNLSRNLVEKAMEHAGTSSPFHNVSISNYEEVRDMLNGTKFERLLH